MNRPLNEIAAEIVIDWGVKLSPHARPYVNAMVRLNKIDDTYGAEDGKTIVLYFLNNAGTWRGEVAKRVKAELKQMAGLK